MNPYVSSIVVAQHRRDLIRSAQESRSTRLARLAEPGPQTGLASRLRQAAAGVWAAAAAAEPPLPRLHGYPISARS